MVMEMFQGFGQVGTIGVEPAEDAVMIRQSTVSSMDLCPARAGYVLAGKAKQVPSEAMSFGTMSHSFAEWRIGDRDGLVNVQMLEQWWVEAVAKDGFDLYDLVSDEVLAESLQEALEMCAAFDRVVLPTLSDPGHLILERRYQMPLGVTPAGREVWLFGTPDAVDTKTRTILDWKTAGRGWDESKAHSTGQAATYSALVEAASGLLILDFIYWVWDRSKREWTAITTERTPSQVDSWMRHTWMRALQIEAGAFPFLPWQATFGKFRRAWYCSAKYCAAWDVCEGKHIQDDVWEEQEIDVLSGWVK